MAYEMKSKTVYDLRLFCDYKECERLDIFQHTLGQGCWEKASENGWTIWENGNMSYQACCPGHKEKAERQKI